MDKLIKKHRINQCNECRGYGIELDHANITKEVACGFAEFLLADFEMSVFEDGRDEDLCWVLGGTNQKSTTTELFDLYIKSL